MEQEERDALGRGELPIPKRFKTTNPYKKNVVVLLEGDVGRLNDQVRMPNTIEMAKIHKPDNGQYKSNIEFTTEMTEMQVKERLLHHFPILYTCARLSCASAKDNRTVLDFHEESQHHGLWNGAMIKKHIKGNSALYVFGETPESVSIPRRLEDATVGLLGPTSSVVGSALTASEKLKRLSRKGFHSGSPVSLGSSPNQIEQENGMLQVDSSQQRTATSSSDQQPISLEAPVIWSWVPEATPPPSYHGRATKEQQETREDQSNRPKVVSEISVHAHLLPGSQCGLQASGLCLAVPEMQGAITENNHMSPVVPSQSQIRQGQLTSTCLANNTVGDQISQNAQTSVASLTEPGILQNDPSQGIALTADQQPISHMSDSGRDSIRSNALGLAVASDSAEQSADVSATSEIFDLSEDIDSILEDGSEMMFEFLTQSSGVVKEIIPKRGYTKTDIRFCIILGQKLPRKYKGLSFQANFANITTVPLERDGRVLTGNIISFLAGEVKVTVEYNGSNGKSIGFTYFEFMNNTEQVILEEISKVRMSQDAMYKIAHSLAVPRSSGVQQETPRGARGIGAGSSNVNKRNDAITEEILTLLVYKAAEIEGCEFLEMVFSTSVGRVVFNHYRNNLTLPGDVARANGHTILADFLEDVNERLSKEVCSEDNYETVDWLELKHAVEKKICLPSTNDAQSVSSPVDNVDQSDYEADDEASPMPSPADPNANGSEMHDSEHGDIEQITSGKNDSRNSIVTGTERPRPLAGKERQAGSGSSFSKRDDSEKEMESLPYGTDILEIKAVAPSEILAKGHSAKLVYEKALRDGFVNVYRGSIVLVGQDRAGKTSLKKTLLGLPFDFKEQSTDGIEIEPSKFEIEVEQIKNWTSSSNKSSLSECSEYKTCLARMLDTEPYHMIVGGKKEDSRMNSEWAQPEEERKVESEEELNIKHAVANEVSLKEDSATKFADRSSSSEIHQGEKGKSSDCSMTLSTKFKLGINATVLPNAVKKHADQLLKNMVLEGVDVEGKNIKEGTTITADVWDFAGQHLYYAAHSVFLSSRAVYIVVHNLSKPLNARAQPCVRQGTHEVTLENPNGETNLENLLSWLMTVHNMRPTGEEEIETSKLPYLRPPVFIVGTHADKPCEDTKDVTSKIHREISSKEYGKHVIRPFFCIDNTQADQSFAWKIWNFFTFRRNPQAGQEGDNDSTSAGGIHALRARILEILQQQPYMGEKIPVRWFNFEKAIEALVAGNIYHTNIAHLQTYAKDVCFIEDDEQFHTMLSFYHDLGMIVRHRNTVILKAQWLISLFKKLITIPPFKKADPVHSKYWLELERGGVLKMELVDHVFSTLIQQGVNKEDILDMMEQFGLIAKYSPSLADVKYFVPCQLRSSPKELCDMVPSPTDPCPLYLHFQEEFVPHGLFTRLVSKSVSWCCANGSSQQPKLYQNGAWFVLEGSVIHDMILICKKKFIKILLRQRTEDGAVPVSHSASEEVARSVRLFIEKVLEKMSEEFPYLSRLQYEFCVECPYCQQGSRQCTNHKQVSCAEDDCLHLLELKQGQNLTCMESMSEKVLRVSGQEKWFLNQVFAPPPINTSQAAPVDGHPTKSSKALRITLLANEWNSSMGGLSTINRQLAILLAKRAELEVTLLVPKSACSEEEKRAAKSHKIVIKEAERRPGFNSLDWLSFPPKDLVIDVVVGHGAKLGKQAQVIRESHCCQWVQVVHTAPEELGMFKNYSRAIARGEEKTTAEVDLCKLANLVVAIGPKLRETYSAYLRSREKQQDIMSFTPGTFKEFSILKQASVDSEKFRVLTFGRGDPEDFDLKGYDIAAKAVVELKHYSYHLIFVGSPDGKQEAVKERLLQSGISKRQLTVRKFLESKEKLKECFCEVDLCIMPSRTEGFGLTALEALSAGLPILVSGNSGFGDALRTVPCGKSFVVDSEDPKVWAEVIAGVRKKKRSQRLQNIERLRASYEEQFSWERQCDLFVDKMWHKVYGAG